MESGAYLERINYRGLLEPTIETLQALHEAHMLAVPFENLDIHLGREIILEEPRLLNKIVEQRRGGFCYEANGAFAALLRSLGFDVSMLAAGVAHPDGNFGPPFDHMTLLVKLEEDWLADVGFGDSFRRPLRLISGLEQVQEEGAYRLEREGDDWTLRHLGKRGEWEAQYRFTLQPHRLSDYTEMCHYQQTSPQSHFTQNRVCSLATPEGRVTLSDMLLITTSNGERSERAVADQREYDRLLAEKFGVVLEP